MANNDFDIHYVANLARIALSPEQEARLAAQLGDILGYVKKLEELDVTGVEPMAHAVPLANVLRSDEVQPSIPQEAALANAPKQANGLFVVPQIVECCCMNSPSLASRPNLPPRKSAPARRCRRASSASTPSMAKSTLS